MSIKRHGFGFCQIDNKWIVIGGSSNYNNLIDTNITTPVDDEIFGKGFYTNWLNDCLMSIDNGLTWSKICDDIFSDNNIDNFNGVYLPNLIYNNDDDILFFGGGYFSKSNDNNFRSGIKLLWKSTNQGVSWEKVIIQPSTIKTNGYNLFYINYSNENRIYFFGGVTLDNLGRGANSSGNTTTTPVNPDATRGIRFSRLNTINENNILQTVNLEKIISSPDQNNFLTPSFFSSGVLIKVNYNNVDRYLLILLGGFNITSSFINSNSRRQTIVYDLDLIQEKFIHSGRAENYNNTTHLELETQIYSRMIYHPTSRLLILLTGFYANNYNCLYTANIDDLINYYDNNILNTGILWRKQFGLTDNNGLPSPYGVLKNAGLFIDDNNLYIVGGLRSKINFDETQFNLINNQLQNLEIDVSSEITKISIKQLNNIYTKSVILNNDNQNINVNDESTSFALSTIGLNRINGLFLEYQLVQDYQLNLRYFGKDNLIEYLPGNLPLILTVPHGGYKNLTYISDRSQSNLSDNIVIGTDNFTYQLALKIREKIYQLTNKYPHVILGGVTRGKCELNRYIYQTENGNSYAVENKDMATAWWEFYNFINIANKYNLDNYNRTFIIDVHGHGLENDNYEMIVNENDDILINNIKGDFIQLGYLLNNNDLFNLFFDINEKFSASKYQTDLNISMFNFIYGNNSLGSILENNGLKSYPSNKNLLILSTNTYFTGGNITKVYGSTWKFNPEITQNTNVIQMELPMIYRTKINREEISLKIALSLKEFLNLL